MNQNRITLLFGVILILAGVVFFAGQVLGILHIDQFWPFLFIGLGLAFFIGMFFGGKSFGALAIPGSIITTIGLIFLVQNAFGIWETWSYAWALIISSVGIGIWIFGAWSDRPEQSKNGLELAKLGLILFLIFGAIFELIFGFTGMTSRSSQIFWSLALVLVGLYLLVSRTIQLIRTKDPQVKQNIDLFWPVILMAIGFTAYLISQGLLSAQDLLPILSLWPLLLIVIGLQLIFGRRFPWVGAILAILLVAVFFTFTLSSNTVLNQLPSPLTYIPSITSGTWNTGEKISGSDIPAEEKRMLEDFNAVVFAGIGQLDIVQGESPSLVIEADDNILPYLTSEVRGNTLYLDVKKGYNLTPRQPIRYTLTFTDLEKVTVNGVGEVIFQPAAIPNLYLKSSGVGSLRLEDLTADQLTAEISGTGSITVAGTCDSLVAKISGVGSFNGGDLQCQVAEVQISGLGKATVWVDNSLKTNISGAGSVSYYGNPQTKETVSGIGVVHSLGDK